MAVDDKRKGRWVDEAATIIVPNAGNRPGSGSRPAVPPAQQRSGRQQGGLEVIEFAEDAAVEEIIEAEPEETLRPRRPTSAGMGAVSGRARRDVPEDEPPPSRSRALTSSRVREPDDYDNGQALVPQGQYGGRRQTSATPAVSVPTPFRAREVGAMCPDESLFMVHSPDSEQAAQYRLLKFRLKESGDPRVIALTSAQMGEGKTVASANLALALAEGRRTRVVILEANLRKPGLPRLFGIEESGGLSEQLRRRRRDPDGPWDVLELANGFHLLHAGKPAENPAAMLNSEEFARLVGELRLHYDFVVVDTPAMLDNTDMTIIQDLMDAVIMVCKAGNSERSAVRKALQRMSPHNVMGMLLT